MDDMHEADVSIQEYDAEIARVQEMVDELEDKNFLVGER